MGWRLSLEEASACKARRGRLSAEKIVGAGEAHPDDLGGVAAAHPALQLSARRRFADAGLRALFCL
jgi:hypothetical protein